MTLGAVNHFTASVTSGARVHIPSPVTYEKGADSPDIRVSGAGRMVGVVLVEESDDVIERTVVWRTLSRFCNAPACTTTEDEQFPWLGAANLAPGTDDTVGVVPPGDYILYVVADGAPVRVKLALDGLTGTRRLHLEKPVDAGVMLPRVRTSEESTKMVYSFGEEVEFSGSSGIAIPMMRFRTGEAHLSRREVCWHSGGPLVPDPLAYGPKCPGAAGIAVTQSDYISNTVMVDGYFTQATGGRLWGIGMNNTLVGEVHEIASLFAYIDVDPNEL